MMHPALKFNFDSFKLRSHSLFRSGPPYGEGCGLVALPTVVGHAQEREGLRFSLASLHRTSISHMPAPRLSASGPFREVPRELLAAPSTPSSSGTHLRRVGKSSEEGELMMS